MTKIYVNCLRQINAVLFLNTPKNCLAMAVSEKLSMGENPVDVDVFKYIYSRPFI